MQKPESWKGVFTALVTPFVGGELDLPAFDALVERQLDAGIAGLVPVGTTGEAATLRDDEAATIIRRCVALARGKVPVVAGAGSNDTATAIMKARAAEKAGADALLLVAPYYNKPSQAGLVRHFDAIASACGLPIMLYSVPGRCGVAIEPDTCARLRERHSSIVAIKEAGGNPLRVTSLRKACGTNFVIHCGDDALTLPFMALGATGLTSVVSNIAPREVVAMVAAMLAGDLPGALVWHEKLSGLADVLFIEPNPGPAKAALAHLGLARPEMRSPLAELSPISLATLVAEIDAIGRAGSCPSHAA